MCEMIRQRTAGCWAGRVSLVAASSSSATARRAPSGAVLRSSCRPHAPAPAAAAAAAGILSSHDRHHRCVDRSSNECESASTRIVHREAEKNESLFCAKSVTADEINNYRLVFIV